MRCFWQMRPRCRARSPSEGFDALPLFVREHVDARLAQILQA
jgi:hypothetical protein